MVPTHQVSPSTSEKGELRRMKAFEKVEAWKDGLSGDRSGGSWSRETSSRQVQGTSLGPKKPQSCLSLTAAGNSEVPCHTLVQPPRREGNCGQYK